MSFPIGVCAEIWTCGVCFFFQHQGPGLADSLEEGPRKEPQKKKTKAFSYQRRLRYTNRRSFSYTDSLDDSDNEALREDILKDQRKCPFSFIIRSLCTCLILRLKIEHFSVQRQAGSVEKVPLFCLTVKGYFSRGGAASGSARYNAFMEGEERAAQHGWRLHLRIPKRAQLNRTQMDG